MTSNFDKRPLVCALRPPDFLGFTPGFGLSMRDGEHEVIHPSSRPYSHRAAASTPYLLHYHLLHLPRLIPFITFLLNGGLSPRIQPDDTSATPDTQRPERSP